MGEDDPVRNAMRLSRARVPLQTHGKKKRVFLADSGRTTGSGSPHKPGPGGMAMGGAAAVEPVEEAPREVRYCLDDLHAYDTATRTWAALDAVLDAQNAHAPLPTKNHTMVALYAAFPPVLNGFHEGMSVAVVGCRSSVVGCRSSQLTTRNSQLTTRNSQLTTHNSQGK